MNLRERVSEDLKSAMKKGDKVRLETLRTMRAVLLEKEIEKRGAGPGMTAKDEIATLTSAAKKRKESIELFTKGGRPELARQEEQELAIIQEYLPRQLTEGEISAFVAEAIAGTGASGPADFGKVMPLVMKQVKGKADGKVVQDLVKESARRILMKFSYLDIFLIAGLALGGFLGYRGGLAKKLFNILLLLFAVVAASRFMTPVGDFFLDAGMLTETEAYVVGFTLVMLAVMIPAILIYRRFGKTGAAKTAGNTVGIFLGVLEAAMVISFILIGSRVFEIPEKDDRQASLLYRPLFNFVPKTFDLLQSYFPGASEFRKQISTKFKDYEIFAKPPHPPGKP